MSDKRVSGFFNSLTPKQQEAALTYDGPENFGFPDPAPTCQDSLQVQTAPAAMPGEEDVARMLMKQFYEDWFAPGKSAHNGSVYWDFVNGESAWTAQARAILDLFAPILAEKQAHIDKLADLLIETQTKAMDAVAETEARALAAEAALAGLRQNIVDAAIQCDDARKAEAWLDRAAAAIRAQGE